MAGQDSHRNPAQAESPSSDAKKGPPPEQLKELVDLPQLQRALRALGSGSQAQSLDSLDEDEDEAPEARLFREAFLEVAGAAESFQVFRSVVRLTPTAVLMQAEHRAVVLERLRDFAGTAAAPESRRSAQALGASLALREPGCAFEVFELLAAALAAVPASLGAGAADAPLSAAGLGQWRRVALADSAAAWNAALSGESKALGWLGATFADQEPVQEVPPGHGDRGEGAHRLGPGGLGAGQGAVSAGGVGAASHAVPLRLREPGAAGAAADADAAAGAVGAARRRAVAGLLLHVEHGAAHHGAPLCKAAAPGRAALRGGTPAPVAPLA
ncbi:unnamed protein product [Effrenium voratum]|nr:unnamed protein product [Effrenium voratum]